MSNASFRIKPVQTPDDLAIVAELFTDYANALPIDLCYQGFEEELASLPGRYGPPGGVLLLAVDSDDSPIGCVGLRPFGLDGVGEMKRLYVAPRGRGLGLGRALATAVVDEAVRLGYEEIRLDTLPTMTEAIALYQKIGFRTIASQDLAPIEGVIYMSRSLRSEPD